MRDLKEIRADINEIDVRMGQLFHQRMQLAKEVAVYKQANQMPVFDKAREEQILENRMKDFPNRDADFLEAVRVFYQTMMDLSKKSQTKWIDQPVPIGYYGVPGAFTHEAFLDMYGAQTPGISCETFEAVFQALEKREIRYGVVPVENSLTGIITDVYDLLGQYDFYIVREYALPIQQNLLGIPGSSMEQIREVYSHPQGFKQSKDFFRDYPHMEQIPFFSTSKSAEEVAEKQDITLGAVAGKAAADLYNLKIIAPAINSNNNNYTRFIIIAKRPEIIPNANKITLIVAVKHETGSLYKMLASFYHTGLNLMNLESRPMVGKSWEYFFFIDVTGNLSDPLVADVIDEVRSKSTYVKILGNYRAYEKKE